MPRRCAPRNDINWSHCEPSPLSLRAEGEAIHLSFRTTCQMDCHVVSLLAMTNRERSLRTIPTVIASRPTVIASRRRSNPAFVLHHLKNRLPRRFTPRNDINWSHCEPKAKQSICRFAPPENRLPRRCAPRNDINWSHCEPKAKQSSFRFAPPEYRLPRRFTPRNDGVGVDCHVVSLLAMTRGGWIGISLCSSQSRDLVWI